MKHLIFAALAAASIQAGVILPGQTITYDSANGGHVSTVLNTSSGPTVAVGSFVLTNPCVSAPTCTFNGSFGVGSIVMGAGNVTASVEPDGTFRPQFAATLVDNIAGSFGRFEGSAILDPVSGRVQVTYTSLVTQEAPEPATWLMAGVAMVGIAIRRR